MKKLKVLLIAYNNLGKGGIQNQLMGIVRSLKDRVDFHIVVWDNVKDYYTPELERYDVKIIRCFRNPGKSVVCRKADAFTRYRDIQRIINNVIREYGPYDAIHCNNAFDAAPCLEAAYNAGIPVRISHAHNTENPNLSKKRTYPVYRALYAHSRKIIRRYATHMVGCSRQVTDYFFGQGIGQVVPIGIDLSEFADIQITAKNHGKYELLHVGNMSEQKNQLFLVEVMDELLKLRNDIHLTMIGGGSNYLKNVKDLISAKGLDDSIEIKPPETNVPLEMAKADLFVFPSTFEGFGIVLIEAQALGLRCIVSSIVSGEANCGGLEYVPLEMGGKHWAELISKKIESGITRDTVYDVSRFSVENMGANIYSIYKSGQ